MHNIVPVYCDYRTTSNDQVCYHYPLLIGSQDDFWDFVYQAITSSYLRPGDIFVCDNAAIHASAETLADFQELLAFNSIELRFLPAYSPEVSFTFILTHILVQSLRASLWEC